MMRQEGAHAPIVPSTDKLIVSESGWCVLYIIIQTLEKVKLSIVYGYQASYQEAAAET